MHKEQGNFLTFNDDQESILCYYIQNLHIQLMPLNKTEFLKLVSQFAEKLNINHRFNRNTKRVGKDFYYEFISRYKNLSLRTTESISLQKAVSFNKKQVDRFLDKLGHVMKRYSFCSSKIFNADETRVSCVYVLR